ncbi:class I mannose-6-phosphate isomerase [Mumia sp. ZJ1417]|uniref:class I mannose-6-phosphate isomerase n=1 Tax=unclassified Mumia TaxID=2621872 RepID=UPI00141E14F7|nr:MULTISPECIES: class I mannose-6-phosphate isomerase [unclassified Mumia]QMW66281.1 class I mannose-6-phosphate isomerase [Mumia sp. ZJ1417]
MTATPQLLQPNLVHHFYAGGARIAALRGLPPVERCPEEWVGATVSRADSPTVGLARTAAGALFSDLVEADPVGWVGTDSVRGGDTGILLKLLDAGQRLPVHVHPDRAFAAQHLDCPYGKTEAWLVLETADDAVVYLGWSGDVDPDELAARRDAQDGDWLLSHLNRIPVRPGDGFVVPAGTPHAIGAGVFVAEVQEPTDFSILLEWSITTSTRDESHLGLGFDLAMDAVSTTALGADDLARLTVRHDLTARTGAPVPLLPEAGDPYFRLHLLAPPPGESSQIAAGFAALVVLSGTGVIEGAGSLPVGGGQSLVVPAAFGPWRLVGDARVLVARPGEGWRGSPDGRIVG